MKVECSKCGSVYELSFTRIRERDKDSIECRNCRTVIHSWHEAKDWRAELIERHDNHLIDRP